MMEITFLGTSCMYPTKERAHPCIMIRKDSEYMLFDCGESAQRQIRIAGISPYKITKIFLTHFHGDHCLGLPGLIESLNGMKRNSAIEIFTPTGGEKKIKSFFYAIGTKPRFEVKITEIKDKKKKIVSNKEFEVYAMPVIHGNIPCLAYSIKEKDRRKINIEYTKKFGLVRDKILGKLQQGKTIEYKGEKITAKQGTIVVPGRKITYITDTLFDRKLIKFAENSDVLISESTYMEKDREKAKDRFHMTSIQAGELAKKSKSKKLYLTHFSQKYEDLKPMLAEAKSVFPETELAEDFMKFSIN